MLADHCVASIDDVQLQDIHRGARSTKVIPALERSNGKIGFKSQIGTIRFRNIEIKDLTRAKSEPASLGTGENAAGVSPDREAAEYVLSLGGAVRVNDHNDDLKEVADLPRGTFLLTGIDLWATKATDATAAHFKDCKNLTHLVLSGTKVTDAGLVHFKDCRYLKSLDLDEVPVGDQGLANFKDCKKLETVGLRDAPITDVGLSYLKGCAGLTSIDLCGTRVGTGGLAALADSGRLKSLNLGQTQVSDLSSLKGMKLTLLYCDKTKVSDLSPLKEMPLEELNCDFKPERDAEILHSIKTLTTINDKPAAEFWKEVEANQGKIPHGSGKPAPPSVLEANEDKGFTPLFNGKDLRGWKVHPSQPGNWRVVKGLITASSSTATNLYTERADYKDFHLRFEMKLTEGYSSVYARAPYGPVIPKEPTAPSRRQTLPPGPADTKFEWTAVYLLTRRR